MIENTAPYVPITFDGSIIVVINPRKGMVSQLKMACLNSSVNVDNPRPELMPIQSLRQSGQYSCATSLRKLCTYQCQAGQGHRGRI